jgi:hypothetical protein
MKYQIQYKKKIPKGFIGMNFLASKSRTINIPYNHKHPFHTIEIKKGLSKGVRLNTEHHEFCEQYFEKTKHYPYHKSHKLALKFELLGKPFPTYNIKENLTKMGFLKRKIRRKKRFK